MEDGLGAPPDRPFGKPNYEQSSPKHTPSEIENLKRMKKNIGITLNALIVFLFMSCNNNYQKEEISNLNAILDSIVTEQYKYIKAIDGAGMRACGTDSIYLQGNQIIQDIEKDNFQEEYIRFCNEYGDERFEVEKWNNKEYLKARIRMMQWHSLNKEIQHFIQSHFQVDLLGFVPTKREIDKNKHEIIEIIPLYINSEQNPIVTINSDTLEYTGDSYLFHCFFKESGEYMIEPEAIVKRWGDTLKFKSGFKINVK